MKLYEAIEKVIDGKTVTCSSLSVIGMKVRIDSYKEDGDDTTICLIDSTGLTSPLIIEENTGLYDDDWEVVDE